jgi:1-acyl-sn-glycerol-3-phosphate acyltransferase
LGQAPQLRERAYSLRETEGKGEGSSRCGRPGALLRSAARCSSAGPLVPVAVAGTDGWRRLRRWRIAFGRPIDISDLDDRARHAAAREATRRLWESVTALEAAL